MQTINNNLIHQEKLNNKKIFFINISSLLMGFSGALLIFVLSSYFTQILETDNVGWLFLITNIILLILLLHLHNFVRIVNKIILFYLIIIAKISIFVALILFDESFISILFLIAYIIFEALSWAVIYMILESYSIDNKSGKIYGFHLTLVNIGFILGPIVSTQILIQYGFSGIFSLALIIHVIIFLIAFLNLKQATHRFTRRTSYRKIFQALMKRKDIQKIFYISFSLEFFFALMVIYTPLYLINQGFTWTEIGLIFTIMLIPFILVQYPAGLLADKKFGEKELLFLSFIILSASTIIFALTASVEIFIITIILLVSRVGAALISILRQSYFYKRIDGNDIELISVFQTAKPIAFIIAPALSTIILIFFPINSVFILSAIVTLSALYPIYNLVDNK